MSKKECSRDPLNPNTEMIHEFHRRTTEHNNKTLIAALVVFGVAMAAIVLVQNFLN